MCGPKKPVYRLRSNRNIDSEKQVNTTNKDLHSKAKRAYRFVIKTFVTLLLITLLLYIVTNVYDLSFKTDKDHGTSDIVVTTSEQQTHTTTT